MTARAPQPKLGYGDYLRFRDLVLERSGLHFPEKKKSDLEIGLFKALAESPQALVNGNYNLDHYYHLLTDKNNPAGRAEMERLINILTVGETHFFRDEAQFSALTTHVLPQLIQRKRAAATTIGPNIQPQLRIWSAGCATGEEPYSIAILLKELLPDLANWRILILATDINQQSLARARRALYSNWSFREIKAKALRPHYFTFNPETKQYQLRDDIQRMVTFASLNLIEDTYPAIYNNTVSMDLILCRNVTIYFTEVTTRKVIKQFYDSLVEEGWLVVGHSEPSLLMYRAFRPVAFPDAFLYQKNGHPPRWSDDWETLAQILEKNEPDKARSSQPTTNGSVSAPPANVTWLTSSPNGKRSTFTLSSATARPAPQASVTSSEADSYDKAREFLSGGHIAEAIEALHNKLATQPDFAPAHALLGHVYADLGHWEEARHWCQSALKLDKLLAEAYYVLGLIYQHEGQIDEAIDMLKKAIYLKREAPLSHFNLAMLYKKRGQMKNAQRACRNVIRILEPETPTTIIAESNGITVKHLLETTRWILNSLEVRSPNE